MSPSLHEQWCLGSDARWIEPTHEMESPISYWGKRGQYWGVNTGAVCGETDVYAAGGSCVCTDRDQWSLKFQLNQKRIH